MRVAAESELYAASGSETERRVYGVNEKDVRNVYCMLLVKKRRQRMPRKRLCWKQRRRRQ